MKSATIEDALPAPFVLECPPGQIEDALQISLDYCGQSLAV